MTLVVDVIIAILLLVTIGYCIFLSKKIDYLRKSKQELRAILQKFDNAVVRAEHNIAALKQITEQSEAQLKSSIQDATIIMDDLNFVMKKTLEFSKSLEARITQQTASKPRIAAPTEPLHVEQHRQAIQQAIFDKNGTEKERVLQSLLEKLAKKQQTADENSPPSNDNRGKKAGYL